MNNRGRPRKEKDEVKAHVHSFRMSDEEARMMEFVREKTGKTRAEIFREGLEMRFIIAKILG